MTLALSLLLALAQAPSPSPTATPPPASPSPAEAPPPNTSTDYRIGAGDVLAITVFGNDDVSRTATVHPSGAITLPLLGEVAVAGLSAAEIQRKLTTLLERDFLVDPQVEVMVREYQSQYVIVVGEVNSPGRKPLRGKTRLIDVLVEAGGFRPGAAGDVVITRTEGSFDGGGQTLQLRLGGGPMTPQEQVNLQIPLRNGDIITALTKNYVTVEGEVNRPGRYPIEGQLTLLGAISTAGGITRFGSGDVKLRRVDPKTGKAVVLEVSLKDVRSGKQADLALLPNDVITVPRRFL